MLEEVLALINTVWAEGCLPKEWKHAVVVPILKPGKEASDPGSYRPIALTAVLCKIMERLVTNRLVYFLETRGLLVNIQNGFRNGRSTMESVAMLDQDIKRAFNNKEVVVGVFLDIEKAYDSLWKEGLLFKIHDLGVRGRMFNWVQDFLKGRTIQVRVGGVRSKVVEIENGTPQGSVISPILFNIMINDIFANIGGGFGLSLFADDGAIWKRGRNVGFILKQVQSALQTVEEWGKTWGFRISVAKSKYLIFGFKRKLPNFSLSMYGSPLEKVRVFKFLGVWFDQRMTWAVHIAKIVEKCEKLINVLRSLAGCEWGADREILHLIYQAMIRSALDYGCYMYGAASKTVLARLDVVQAKALRQCCGAFRTSPIPAMLVEMGEMPLWLRRIKLGLQYWVKLCGSNQSFPARCLVQEVEGGFRYKVFIVEVNQWARKLGMEQRGVVEHIGWLPIPPWVIPRVNVAMHFLLNRDKAGVSSSVQEYLNSVREDKVIIYTDGSRDPDSRRAGFGVYVEQYELEFSVRISNESSVFTAELMAILWALWWVEEAKVREVIICSDSAAGLEAIRGGKSKARPDILNDILSVVFRIREGSDITFCWVPGHVGIRGNEQVDLLAKQSLHKEVEVYLPLGRGELREKIKEGVIREWQEGWEKEERGRFFFSIQPQVRRKCCCNIPSRRDSVKLCRLRLGHCGLNYTLCILGKHETGLCKCGRPETVKHVFLECAQYNMERSRLYGQLTKLGVQVFSFYSLFGHSENHQQIARAVLQFLHDTKLYGRI